MSAEGIKKYIEETRDCDQALLDNAIEEAIAKARGDKLDFKKIFGLTGAFAALALLFIILDIRPMGIEVDAEVLHTYFINFTNTLNELFGRY